MAEEWFDVMPLDQIAPGDMAGFEIGERQIAIYRVGDMCLATDNICSHAFALLSEGWFDGELVECPLHGAQFDVRTGRPVLEPADTNIETFQTRIVDGMVQVLMTGE